jgi:hypothetical protein
VQQNHVVTAYTKNYPRDPVAIKVTSHFPQTVTKRRTMGASDRPPEFDFLNIFSDSVSVGFRQVAAFGIFATQPAHRMILKGESMRKK